jgi:hypothetical protein
MQLWIPGPLRRAAPGSIPGVFIALLSASVLFSAGCASNGDIGATFDPLVPFPATAVWGWDDAENHLPADDRIDSEELDRAIKSAVASEFTKRGYSEASGDKVQYLLSYEVGIQTWMSQSEARAFGTLSVLMTEAANQRKVWLGFLRLQVDMSLTPEQRDARLQAMVGEMLKDFPPSQPDR